VLAFAFAWPPMRDERSRVARGNQRRSTPLAAPHATRIIVADEKTIALNRRARHEFSIDETFEAGIVLTGTEIKSIRAGKVNLSDAYARIERDEAWLIGAHIAPFEQANRYNHEPKRIRKLLLRRSEIDELLGRTKAKGQTIVPLRLYLTPKGRAKLELGLARGKNLFDRRRDIADRDAKRDVAREMADAQRGRR
jgi:SsrA-binding protein